MIMSWIFTVFLAVSCVAAVLTGRGAALAASVLQGCESGISLAMALSGSLCLWTGIGALMERGGITEKLSRLIRPFLVRIFPSTGSDPVLAGYLSANICANFLGLGNAATPMGIRAVKRMAESGAAAVAGDEMCRLVVLNTASIQLIPANVAAVRGSLGCVSPFDILPMVWITSLCSAAAGLAAAWLMGKLWRHD